MHVAAEGELEGRLQRQEFVRAYYPRDVAGTRATAIAWTTSASVVAVIEMVRAGSLSQQGFLKQEEVPLEVFLQTRTGGLFAEGG